MSQADKRRAYFKAARQYGTNRVDRAKLMLAWMIPEIRETIDAITEPMPLKPNEVEAPEDWLKIFLELMPLIMEVIRALFDRNQED